MAINHDCTRLAMALRDEGVVILCDLDAEGKSVESSRFASAGDDAKICPQQICFAHRSWLHEETVLIADTANNRIVEITLRGSLVRYIDLAFLQQLGHSSPRGVAYSPHKDVIAVTLAGTSDTPDILAAVQYDSLAVVGTDPHVRVREGSGRVTFAQDGKYIMYVDDRGSVTFIDTFFQRPSAAEAPSPAPLSTWIVDDILSGHGKDIIVAGHVGDKHAVGLANFPTRSGDSLVLQMMDTSSPVLGLAWFADDQVYCHTLSGPNVLFKWLPSPPESSGCLSRLFSGWW